MQEEEKLVPQDRVQQPTVEHAPVLQILEQTVEVFWAPTKREPQRTVDVPMPQVLKGTDEAVTVFPRDRVQQWAAEQIVDVPQKREETVEALRLALQERMQWIDEQMEEVYSIKEEFLTKMDELRTQLDERIVGADIKDPGPDRRSRCGGWRFRSVSPLEQPD